MYTCLILSLQLSFDSKNCHKLLVIQYMFIVETMTNRAAYTSNDVLRAYFGTSPLEHENVILGLL